MFFNVVKDSFKCIQGLKRSLSTQKVSEKEEIINLAALRKKQLICCQISHYKTRYIVFQHKLYSNIIQELFKRIEGLRRSVRLNIDPESERFLNLAALRKKVVDMLSEIAL